MNHGAMIAIRAAAAAAKARTEVLDTFRLKDATAPDRARALHDLGLPLDSRALRELFESGVLRGVDSRGRPLIEGGMAGAGDRFYLDEAAFVARRDGAGGGMRRRQLIAVAAALGVLLLGFVFAFLTGRSN